MLCGPATPPGITSVGELAVFRREITTGGPDETRALGAALGGVAEPGDAFLLEGQFGSGKTVLVQGLAAGLGVETFVASPSFIIVNQHQGRLPLYHVDLFRLDSLDPELEDTLAELLEAGGVTAIEWPMLLPADLWQGATVLRFSLVDQSTRLIDIETPCQRLARAVDALPAPLNHRGAFRSPKERGSSPPPSPRGRSRHVRASAKGRGSIHAAGD